MPLNWSLMLWSMASSSSPLPLPLPLPLLPLHTRAGARALGAALPPAAGADGAGPRKLLRAATVPLVPVLVLVWEHPASIIIAEAVMPALLAGCPCG